MNSIPNFTLLAQESASSGILQRFLVPGLIVGIVLGLMFIVMAVASRYKRVPPNAIGVFYGRKYPYKTADGNVGTRGFLIVSGGGRILLPVVERYQEMSTAAFQVPVSEKNIPSSQKVGINVVGVATCRVSSIPEDQANAVQAFMGKSPAEIEEFISQILKGHVRSIVGKMDIDELLRDRAKFNQLVVEESSEEFRRLGIQIVTLVIQDIKDEHGYIEALGKQAIAETVRDATIKVAQADAETAIKTSDAQRDAAARTADNEVLIAEARRNQDIKVAGFKIDTETKRAEADTAFYIAKAAQEQKQKVAEAERDAAAAKAGVAVQKEEALRFTEQLNATTITQANADRQAAVIEAEAQKAVATLNAERAKIEAEGVKNAAVLQGQGESQRELVIAEAKAMATQKTATATAEGEKAKLLAAAEGHGAQLLAEAKGEEAKLLAIAKGKQAGLEAEAEGTAKLADALRDLSDQGKLMLFLDRLPGLLAAGGDAGQKIAAEVFGAIGKSIERMGPVTITDLGGGATANSSIGNMAGMVPNIVVNVLSQLAGRGIDVMGLLGKMGIDAKGLQGLMATPPTPAATSEPEPAAPPPAPAK